ncbi:MAG: hypothetical protein Sapg2KO_41620 [Saprospiraceae bacterium]
MASRISELLREAYVFPEVGEKAAAQLIKAQKNGQFKQYNDPASLAAALTKHIYESTKDKHLVVSVRNRNLTPETEEDRFAARIAERAYFRSNNAGFRSITKLDHNIGYLKMSSFYGLDIAQERADLVMSLLSTSDAIIIDLRNNSGGRGDMVDYLLGHFLGSGIEVSKATKRIGDNFRSQISKTPPLAKDKMMLEVPLYVLTNNKTISAAEGFSFGLKIHDRATFIGETTAGGANPGDLIPISDDLQFFVSDVSVTHPNNDSSWEGIGVIPDIKVTSEKALEVAMEAAKKAANQYKEKSEQAARQRLLTLESQINNFTTTTSTKQLVKAYVDCKEDHLFFWEWELNNLGYSYLGQAQNAKLGEAILEANKVMYPISANVHDSYGDALMASDQTERAIHSYKEAVALGKMSEHQNLEQFQQNLANAKSTLAKDLGDLSTKAGITRTLMDYIEGTSNGEPERLRRAFHPDFNLFTVTKEGNLRIRSGEQYIGYFPKNKKTGRIGKVLSIDAQGEIAVAKVGITMANTKEYIDYFLLLKYEGSWKIVHKSYIEK